MIRFCILATALAVAVPATTGSTRSARGAAAPQGKTVRLSTDRLRDKIKGGWAGQTIGVTFGGPTEFRYRGTMIGDGTKNRNSTASLFEYTVTIGSQALVGIRPTPNCPCRKLAAQMDAWGVEECRWDRGFAPDVAPTPATPRATH